MENRSKRPRVDLGIISDITQLTHHGIHIFSVKGSTMRTALCHDVVNTFLSHKLMTQYRQ